MLVGAFAFQHIGGMPPCQMCIWQRYPHVAAVFIGAAALMLGNRALVLLGAVAAGVTSGIGFFHAGVEQGWWEGVTSCAATGIDGLSVDELMEQVMTAPVVRCDEIPWEMFGISMAGWNGLISLGLMGLWLFAFTRR
jgi:disulfide bond formation protein DsbB